ncbi:hypothetical protein Tco_1075382, partial [Tanacetum coccineum]
VPSAKAVLMANLSSYDSDVLSETHVALFVTDSEETLELAEESRIKMLAKQNDPSLKEKKVNIAPVDYVALNKLFEHFVKHFVPQKQLSAEQWLETASQIQRDAVTMKIKTTSQDSMTASEHTTQPII